MVFELKTFELDENIGQGGGYRRLNWISKGRSKFGSQEPTTDDMDLSVASTSKRQRRGRFGCSKF